MIKKSQTLSILYHDIFDYPLTRSELKKWQTKDAAIFNHQSSIINHQNGYFFLEGREALLSQRKAREIYCQKKLKIAQKAVKKLTIIPSIKMMAITGSLAMGNAKKQGDIDLLIIIRKNTLWITRLIAYCLLLIARFDLRRAGESEEEDRLCLNMWLDEDDVVWDQKDRNIFTAHEIAQVMPLFNKHKTYERFIMSNQWVAEFWPNSLKIRNLKFKAPNKHKALNYNLEFIWNLVIKISNLIAFKMQYWYMRKRITREVVTPTRALFHPNDGSKSVLAILRNKYGYTEA